MLCVTGASGFVGTHVCNLLRRRDIPFIAPPSGDIDLRNHRAATELLDRGVDRIIHLAARVGGIGYNQRVPADLFLDNIRIGATILDACRIGDIERLVFVSTTCGYPHTPLRIPFVEDDFFAGLPEPTNAGYGIAKRSMLVGCDALHKQVGLRYAYLICANMYGPGDDSSELRSHVIPALIEKFREAKRTGATSVTVWGTGRATRDFLYVEDCADAIIRALDVDPAPNFAINVGSGEETSIRDLAYLIADASGYRGSIVFDPTRPDGQPRRVLDCTRAREILGWSAKTKLSNGLQKTHGMQTKIDANP